LILLVLPSGFDPLSPL